MVQASGYIGTYLSQGWQKMIEPAAIALATTLAMGLVELAMELGFKAIGKGLNKAGKAVKSGIGAAGAGVKKAEGAGVKGMKSLLKSGAKLASKSGSMIIRGGKIVIKSLRKGLMKGAKKLSVLLDRVLQRFKFKKFKLERKGKHIRLYGEINPWVLLADGTIEEVESLEGRKAGISTQAELDKLSGLKTSERIDVYNSAVARKDGKIDFDSILEKDSSQKWSPDKRLYSVAYEMKLPIHMYPEMSDARHFQEANKKLHEAFQADSIFAQQMEELYPGIIAGVKPGKRGAAFPRKPPTPDVTWHHEPIREGILQLIPFDQHTAKGEIQSVLHPNGKGGMEIWGEEEKEKNNEMFLYFSTILEECI